ncbi:MAG: YbjQ family protein [Candidatus Paceibacterota bacterium]
MNEIIITTGETIPNKKITKILGVVKGSTVRARNIGRDIGAGFKSIIGGEVKTYTDMTANARDEAYNRMVNNALEMKAHAIINVRFTTSMVMAGASEMLAYGTAVELGEN